VTFATAGNYVYSWANLGGPNGPGMTGVIVVSCVCRQSDFGRLAGSIHGVAQQRQRRQGIKVRRIQRLGVLGRAGGTV